jgi:asparagine synthase (glutamine-hydrolysing)
MCGIAGYIDYRINTTSKEILAKMTNVLSHRGPDDVNTEVFELDNCSFGMGHRRLSIIDISSLGRQPMSYKNRFTIVYNGEIYNYKEIKNELENYGHSFISNSDTEVLMAAYDQWGISFISKLIGMFAFVLFDSLTNDVFIVRDRAGVKPLYFYSKDGLYLFASELKSFHQHDDFVPNLDYNSLVLYLTYGHVSGTNCIFQNCEKVEPGHYFHLNLNSKKLTKHKYWDVYTYYEKPDINISEEEIIEETHRILNSACQYRMVSDVPVGVFLSGGYDSSLVTSLIQSNTSSKISTFSIGFEDVQYNEAPFAKAVANHLGTNHNELICTPEDAINIIPKIPYYFDEPFGDSSAIPTMLVSKFAKESVSVALSADAGDEVFVGYKKYDGIKNLYNKSRFIPKNISTIINNSIRHTKSFLPGRKFDYLSELGSKCAINNIMDANKYAVQYFNSESLNSLISFKIKTVETYYDLPPNLRDRESIENILAIDYKTYLPDDILTKVDRATMSVSLEGREPLLDHRIIEWAAMIPINVKYKAANKKYILKKIVHDYIPETIMDRPKKGFSIPLHIWFKKELSGYFEHYFSMDFITKQGIFHKAHIDLILYDYKNLNSMKAFNKLWILLVFQMWWEKWM